MAVVRIRPNFWPVMDKVLDKTAANGARSLKVKTEKNIAKPPPLIDTRHLITSLEIRTKRPGHRQVWVTAPHAIYHEVGTQPIIRPGGLMMVGMRNRLVGSPKWQPPKPARQVRGVRARRFLGNATESMSASDFT